MKITAIEVFTRYNAGWGEIEFYGVEDLEVINQLFWISGKKGAGCLRYKFCSVNMRKAIEEGKSPAIQISERRWNDESSGLTINMAAPGVILSRRH